MGKLTPMMEQYFEIKQNYKDCILFFRLGDFYEMFYEDAIIASKELEIALTGKSCGQEEKAPMCGVPFHSAEVYISKLVERGHKVAVCEQVEDAKIAKGIVKRDVIRVVTPGTILDNNILDEKKNNYLMSIYLSNNKYGISIVDISTGEFLTTQVEDENRVLNEIGHFNPVEILCNETFIDTSVYNEIKSRFAAFISTFPKIAFEYKMAYRNLCAHFSVVSLDGYGLKGFDLCVSSSGALIEYLIETQKINLSHILNISVYSTSQYMTLDISSRRNLELTETLRDKSRKGSLLWVLDKTKSVLGARLLRKWIDQPLLNKVEIEERLNGVEELKENILLREELKEYLSTIYDIERLMTRIVYGTASPKDLLALKISIKILPFINQLLDDCNSNCLKKLQSQFDNCEDIYELIEKSIADDAPFLLREGGVIKDGYNVELDKLRQAKNKGTLWLSELEASEKQKTKIKNLKIRYNKIFGYYIEITNSNKDMIPDRYIRKQTVANAERFITPELKELEETILGAEEKIIQIEYLIFSEIRSKLAENIKRLQTIAYLISTIDVLQSLGEVADKEGYVKPEIIENGVLNIIDGRHPVVEKTIENFVSNNTYLDIENNRLSIITGPNMAGKSTYMRQVALIVLMAQIGSFVPAKEAHISVVDRIFTRVGASDDLSAGQSTFMVEMSEVANILNNATKNSLLILDEIGRGTSTFDGLSIAWAVLEYISNEYIIGAKTLFSTHYHELTELEGRISGVVNYCIDVKEENDDITFLHKIKRGGANNSYGIQVAKLAGLPNCVIDRSKEILSQLSDADIAKNVEKVNSTHNETQANTIIEELKSLNVMSMTPIQAFQILTELQQKL